MTETVSTPTEQPAAPQVELTIVDLRNIQAIIDVASRRGAFGAGELSEVGRVFDRLTVFLNTVDPEKTAEQTATQ